MDRFRFGRVVPRLVLGRLEGRDFAVALPKLHVVTVDELPGVRLRRIVIRTGKLDCAKKPAVYSDNERPIFGHLWCSAFPRSPALLRILSTANVALESGLNQQNDNKFNWLSTHNAHLQIHLPSPAKSINLTNE